MADGDRLLDTDGNRILDADGNVELSDGSGDACCCGKQCFQEWIASWSCSTQSWSGPVTDNRLCLPAGSDTAWVKIAGDASGCEYKKLVPYDPPSGCSVNGDCTSELGDTDTPDLPFGGGPPPDCCVCTIECLADPDPGLCPPPGTPTQFEVTIISAAASALCVYDGAAPFEVHIMDASGLAGQSFTLTLASGFVDTFDVSAFVKILSCNGAGTGCGACTPSTDITGDMLLTISLTPLGAPSFHLHWSTTSSSLDNSPTGYDQTLPSIVPDGDGPTTCCEAYTFSGPSPNDFSPNELLFIEHGSVVPC